MRRTFTILISLTLLFGLTVSGHAQRIGIDTGTKTDTSGGTTAQKVEEETTDTSASRIIPPEEFGSYRDRTDTPSDLSKSALVEKLRADSAAMRIRFQERLRRLRADSRAMRKRIESLKKTVAKLRRKLGRTPSAGKKMERSDTPRLQRAGMEPTDTGAEAAPPTDRSEAGETLPEGARMNPNSASLSELKSIPGLSDRLAERIEWYRRVVAPFDNIQDLKQVPGVDRQVFNNIKKYFRSGPY